MVLVVTWQCLISNAEGQTGAGWQRFDKTGGELEASAAGLARLTPREELCHWRDLTEPVR